MSNRSVLGVLCGLLWALSCVAGLASSERWKAIDGKTQKPLHSATVYVRCLAPDCAGSIKSVKTDKNGEFSVPFALPVAVEIRFIGYAILRDTLRANSPRALSLIPTAVQMETVVATGQYSPTSTDKSVHTVKIIDRERIEAQGAVTLRDVLQTQLNVRIEQDRVLGAGMSVQGVQGRGVKILIDGVPVVGRLNGNIDVSQINLNAIERIEIVEGPLAVMYGTDAIGGVVNLITRTPEATTVNGSVRAYAESVGQYNADGKVGMSFDGNDFLLSGGRNLFDGFNSTPRQRAFEWNPKEQYFGELQYKRAFGDLSLRYSGRVFNELILNRGEPRLPYGETAFDDHYRTLRLTNSLFVEGKVSDERSVSLTAAHSWFRRRKNSFIRDLVTLTDRPTADPADQDTTAFTSWMVRGLYSFSNPDKLINYQVGLDANLDGTDTRRIPGDGKTMNDVAAFGSLVLNLTPDLTVQPGIRYAYNDRYAAPVIPSVNVRAKISNEFAVRASWAKGFRAPSLQELYFLFVDINHNIRGNTDLRAETSDNLTLAGQVTITHPSGFLRIEPTLFYNDINNLISLAQVEGALYSYVNIDRFRTQGASLNISCVTDFLNASVGASYTGRSNTLAGSAEVPEFSYTPELQLSATWNIPGADLRFATFAKYTGVLPGFMVGDDNSVRQVEMASYTILDASLAHPFLDNTLLVSLGVKNVANTQNVQNSLVGGGVHSAAAATVPVSWGRTLFMSVEWNLR